MSHDSYKNLCQIHEEITLIGNAASTLDWDQETYMPKKAIKFRAKQLAYFYGKTHALATSADYGKYLADSEQHACDNAIHAANLREWRHHYDLATKLPQELVERDSSTSSLAKAAWAEAREKNDFTLFAPHLSKLVDIAKEKAELWGYDSDGEPYDALLGRYERGAKTRDISAIFDQYEPELVATAQAATARSADTQAREFTSIFPIEQQKILNREIAESIGFDFSAGRIDTTTHPFCTTLGPTDIRLTTRYYEHDFTASLFGVLHETGHGLYEQGLPTEHFGTPAGSSISLGIHESQSLLWEAHVGRSRSFWQLWLPRAQELFPQLADWSLDDFLLKINQARYSFIRVDADEATYDLHILLRYNLERDILTGKIAIEDIPAAWDERFTKLFGITPPSDSEGCLQDIHWSMGGFGYFPTYTMGNLNASQLFQAATKEAAVKEAFEHADFKPLLDWMRTHIHSQGSQLLPQDLMLQASGECTSPCYHLAHLKRRFC